MEVATDNHGHVNSVTLPLSMQLNFQGPSHLAYYLLEVNDIESAVTGH
jgi:hypothetical protein